MSAVPAGTLISSILVARNSRSTPERREKSGIFRRSSTLVVTDRSFVSSASYHALRYWYAVAVVCSGAHRRRLGAIGAYARAHNSIIWAGRGLVMAGHGGKRGAAGGHKPT